jgi:transcriptional regulator with XRE-family HTH domain
MVAYYESQKGNPPADLLPKFAEVLDVSIDELFGRRPRAAKTDAPRNLRLWRKLRRVETLPPKDREAVLRLIDAFFRNRDSDR